MGAGRLRRSEDGTAFVECDGLCAIVAKCYIRRCAVDRQDAPELSVGRFDPPGAAAGDADPLPPQSPRHSTVDPSNPFQPAHVVSDGRRGAGRLCAGLSETVRPLAARIATGAV